MSASSWSEKELRAPNDPHRAALYWAWEAGHFAPIDAPNPYEGEQA